MKKLSLLCCAALASLVAVNPAAAINGTISLAHDDCLVDGGLQTRNTDCVTNNFAHFMVITFALDAPMTQFVGNEIVLDMIDNSNPAALGNWWQWDGAGCRSGGLSAFFDPSVNSGFSGASCQDPFASSASGASGAIGLLQRPSSGTGMPVSSQRIIVGVALQSNDPVALSTATQYTPLTLRARASTAQTAACTGCGNSIVMSCNSILVAQLPGAPGGDALISTPNPFAANGSCVTFNQASSVCAAGTTPASQRTWGQVKSLYR
jgi:hypothetical protein